MLKQAPIYLGIIFSLILLSTSCQSTRKNSDPYAYLRKGNKRVTPKNLNEPYEVVDIAVLDTSRAPGKPIDVINTTDDIPVDISLPAKSIMTVLEVAKSYLGTPYLYGGNTRQGIDCSGLVFAAYLSIEMTLPRTSRQLAATGEIIKRKKLQPGDLVFFSSRMDGNINHVGLVTQVNGAEISFIHATVSKGVREDRLDIGYWSERFIKAVRVG